MGLWSVVAPLTDRMRAACDRRPDGPTTRANLHFGPRTPGGGVFPQRTSRSFLFGLKSRGRVTARVAVRLPGTRPPLRCRLFLVVSKALSGPLTHGQNALFTPTTGAGPPPPPIPSAEGWLYVFFFLGAWARRGPRVVLLLLYARGGGWGVFGAALPCGVATRAVHPPCHGSSPTNTIDM